MRTNLTPAAVSTMTVTERLALDNLDTDDPSAVRERAFEIGRASALTLLDDNEHRMLPTVVDQLRRLVEAPPGQAAPDSAVSTVDPSPVSSPDHLASQNLRGLIA